MPSIRLANKSHNKANKERRNKTMAKAILMSIRPQHVANILNGIKTLEIRKRFPKDYVGWVYIYCTKEQGLARLYNGRWNDTFVCEKDITDNEFKRMYSGYDGKGKVVARFWCDKVEEIRPLMCGNFYHFEYGLTTNQLNDYLNNKSGKAIHITKLEIFNKPKELKEFTPRYEDRAGVYYGYPLTHAPQSFMFIEA